MSKAFTFDLDSVEIAKLKDLLHYLVKGSENGRSI